MALELVKDGPLRMDGIEIGAATAEEKSLEPGLRPQSFSEYIGQTKIVNNLRIFLKAALRRADLPDWPALEAEWRRSLDALAVEVRNGLAAVAPRDIVRTCRECGLQSLCRIGAVAHHPIRGRDGDA